MCFNTLQRLLFSICFASTAPALALFPSSQQIPILSDVVDGLKIGSRVPGDSPASYCSDPQTDIFKIRRLDFLPMHPKMSVFPLSLFVIAG